MTRITFVSICLLLSLYAPGRAEDGTVQAKAYSLQECIDIALENQTDLLVARNDVEMARDRSIQARSTYFPQLSIQNNAFVMGSKGLLTRSETGTALTMDQDIYDGGLREARVKGSRYVLDQSKYGLSRVEQIAVFDVTRAYYEVLRAKQLAEVAEASVKYNDALRELVQTRIDVGDAASVDVLPVESQLANARVNLLTARNSVRTAAIRLQNAIGLSPEPGFDVQDVDQLPDPQIKPVDNYIAAAIETRPDVGQSEAAVGAARASVRSSRIMLYPRPVISGRYERGLAGGLGAESSQIVGGISFGLFNGRANRAAYHEAQKARASADLQAKQVVKDIQAEIQEAYLNLTSAKERVQASEVGLTAGQKNYEVQEARYKQGLAIPLDLLNAEVQLVTARTASVEARYDYYISIAQMNYAVGRPGGFDAN